METTKTLNAKTELIDPSIANVNPEQCNLSILFQKDGLVFSVLRNGLDKYIVLGEYVSNATTPDYPALFAFKNQLQGNFAAVQLGFFTPKFTLVPLSLFSTQDLETYAKFQFTTAADEVLRVDELTTHGLAIVYALPSTLAKFCDDLFGKHVLRHAAYFSICYYLNQYKNKPGEHLHANIWRNQVDVTVVKNGKLILSNGYAFETDEDVLYFLLNIHEQLALNPETVPLKLSGEIAKDTNRWQLLQQYIRFVELEKRPPLNYSHEFKDIPEHAYNRVFQAALCV